jgi:hypothetical protein
LLLARRSQQDEAETLSSRPASNEILDLVADESMGFTLLTVQIEKGSAPLEEDPRRFDAGRRTRASRSRGE